MFTLNNPLFLLPGDIILRLTVSMAIGSAVSTLIHSKHRGSIGEKTLLQVGKIHFNFRCQNKMGLVLDSQPYDAGITYWISSTVS